MWDGYSSSHRQRQDKLAKLIPNTPGFSLSIGEAVEKVKELKDLYKSDARAHQLLDYGKSIEGLSRHASVHAAGVVIAPGPLDEYVPVCRDTKNDDQVITQYDMVGLEKAGMLKMDFLGLRTLTVIHDAEGAIPPASREVDIDWDEIGLDDPEVYSHARHGRHPGRVPVRVLARHREAARHAVRPVRRP